MDKTIKDKTIEELLLERRILIKKITSLWCAYDEHVTITVQIEAIDKFIKQLNNIKD